MTPKAEGAWPAHVILGALAGVLTLIEFVWRLTRMFAGSPASMLDNRSGLRIALHWLIALLLALALASGYVQLVAGSPQPEFLGLALSPMADLAFGKILENIWGAPIAVGVLQTTPLSEVARDAHGLFAALLLVFLLIYLAVLTISTFDHIVGDNGPYGARPALSGSVSSPYTAEVVTNFGNRLRVVGWTVFWVQLLLAVACGLLLQLAQSGRSPRADQHWFGEPIGWASVALALMGLSLLLGYGYVRLSKHIVRNPNYYLDPRHFWALWFLSLGVLVGLVGVLASFGGVGLSAWHLISKIVSQPPGIAITDPTNFIRVLDILTLIANIALLGGHVMGAGVTLWLRIHASHARVDLLEQVMVAAPPPAVVETPPPPVIAAEDAPATKPEN